MSVRKFILAGALTLERIVIAIGQASGWLMLPLIGIIVFDAVCRKFLRHLDFVINSGLYHLMNSSKIQDLEWHLHTVVFFLAIAYTYAHNMHVRLDIFRERFKPRTRVAIELGGAILLLLPFLFVLNLYAYEFWESSWRLNEGSSVATGLGSRWVIKASVMVGFALMTLITVSLVARFILFLLGESAQDTKLEVFVDDAKPYASGSESSDPPKTR